VRAAVFLVIAGFSTLLFSGLGASAVTLRERTIEAQLRAAEAARVARELADQLALES
jgi:DNA-binding transcriptional MocR family regulator